MTNAMFARRSHTYKFAHDKQRGAALMVMLVIMIMGTAAFLVSALNSSSLQIERDKKTADALAKAKDALIGYAITYGDTNANSVHGYLPCPDTGAGTEGSADAACGNQDVSRVGRLPWRTLGLPALRDGSSECLWYEVSGTYKNNPKTGLMNWDTQGLLNVSDANGGNTSDIVAIIISPGSPLGNQTRTPTGNTAECGGNYTAANYLDNNGTYNNASVSTIANAVSSFFSGSTSQVNDRVIYITRKDIFNALSRRNDFNSTLTLMTQKVAECIAFYGTQNADTGTHNINSNNNSLPWPAPLSLADYTVNANYNDAVNLFAGRVPYKVDTSYATTNNQMNNSNLLVSATNCPSGWATIYPWWNNWKDHLFYAIAKEFRPISGSSDTNSCGTCLQVNGQGQYAAVVMFAGQALSGQNRADKSVLSAYLEGSNLSNNPNSGGNSNYQGGNISGTFNDVLFCIKTNLSVVRFDPVQGKCP